MSQLMIDQDGKYCTYNIQASYNMRLCDERSLDSLDVTWRWSTVCIVVMLVKDNLELHMVGMRGGREKWQYVERTRASDIQIYS